MPIDDGSAARRLATRRFARRTATAHPMTQPRPRRHPALFAASTALAVCTSLASPASGCASAPSIASPTRPAVMAIATAPPVGASSLARTAPRGTRALARFEVATLLGSPSVSAALLALPQLEEIEDCDVV